MKACAFEYLRPDTVDEACSLLEGGDALLIAGGQTLVPMLAMRLARPGALVDIGRLTELHGIAREDEDVVIGAAVTQAAAEGCELVARDVPLLNRVMPWIGHRATRSRGTVGGSICNADPSAEIPLVAVTLGAELVVREREETAIFNAGEFFFGPMITAMPDAGCLMQVRFPVWTQERVGTGFHEISARRSDFAFVSAAAQIALDEDGRCARAVLGIGGAGDCPVALDVGSLAGEMPDAANIRNAARAATADLETVGDLHASAAYRLRVATELAMRALTDATARTARGRAEQAS